MSGPVWMMRSFSSSEWKKADTYLDGLSALLEIAFSQKSDGLPQRVNHNSFLRPEEGIVDIGGSLSHCMRYFVDSATRVVQYKNEWDVWVDYEPKVASYIGAAKKFGYTHVVVWSPMSGAASRLQNSYLIDFGKDTQTNTASNFERSIRTLAPPPPPIQIDPLLAKHIELLEEKDANMPEVLTCPISKCIFTDPVVTSEGCTFERTHIQKWIDKQITEGNDLTSPITGAPIEDTLTPNLAVRSLLVGYLNDLEEDRHVLRAMGGPRTMSDERRVRYGKRKSPLWIEGNRSELWS